jgi:plasmid maintenance system antidote protein VapI
MLIKALRNEGLKLTEIAEKFELTKSHVSKIINNKTWKHLGNEI